MTKSVGFVRAYESLAAAVGIMWEKDCGIAPVLDDSDKVIGVVTDRDICVAVSTKNQLASKIPVNDLINKKPLVCSKKDTIGKVLRLMQKHQIKRLPVTKKNGELIGIVSINDILQMKKGKKYRKQIIKTLKAIGKPTPILLKEL